MTTLFDHVDAKERKRVGKKLGAFAEEQHRRLLDIQEQDRKASAEAVEYCKETSRLAIRADYASTGEEPVVTAGLLVSPQLVAYGRRHAEEMKRHAIQADARKAKEAGDAKR